VATNPVDNPFSISLGTKEVNRMKRGEEFQAVKSS
jgi:hypothetical protein